MMDELIGGMGKRIGPQLQRGKRGAGCIAEDEPQITGLRAGQWDVTAHTERFLAMMHGHPLGAVIGNHDMITPRRKIRRPFNHQPSETQRPAKVHLPPWLCIIPRRTPTGRRTRIKHRNRLAPALVAAGNHRRGRTQRLVLEPRFGQLEKPLPSRPGSHDDLHRTHHRGSPPARRPPCEWQLTLMQSEFRPLYRHREIRPQMAPDIGATWISHLELEMIRGAPATQVEADFKRFRQPDIHLPTDHHEAAAAMEIIIQPQSVPALPAADR